MKGLLNKLLISWIEKWVDTIVSNQRCILNLMTCNKSMQTWTNNFANDFSIPTKTLAKISYVLPTKIMGNEFLYIICLTTLGSKLIQVALRLFSKTAFLWNMQIISFILLQQCWKKPTVKFSSAGASSLPKSLITIQTPSPKQNFVKLRYIIKFHVPMHH